jgi:uncharacterized membrane protein HdeD (DUF308 family)
MEKKKRFLEFAESIGHLCVGIAITMKGVEKLSHHPIIGSFILLFGVVLLLYFIYEKLKKVHSRTFKLLVHLFEGLAFLFLSYIYFIEAKIYLPYVTLTISIVFLVSGIVRYIVLGKVDLQKREL